MPSKHAVVAVTCISNQAPGAARYHGIVVSDSTGEVFQRVPDADGGLVWKNISPPHGPIFAAGEPADSSDQMYFVTDGGVLLRRDFSSGVWLEHARDSDSEPGLGDVKGGGALVVDARSLIKGAVFALSRRGELVVKHPDKLVWTDHGKAMLVGNADADAAAAATAKSKAKAKSVSKTVRAALSPVPGVALPDLNSIGSLFLLAQASGRGVLAEYWWNKSALRWVWIDHGAPEGSELASAPGALINSRSVFAVTAAGHLAERYWDGRRWVWIDHGRPSRGALAPVRPVKLFHEPHNEQLIVVMLDNERLAARVWRNDKAKWAWRSFNVPEGGTARYCSNDDDDPQNHCIGATHAPY